MKSTKKLISITIPAYNEAANLDKLMQSIYTETQKLDYLFEYIIVNDGSKDETREIVQKLAKKDKNISLINFSRNFGKEAATTAGIHSCTGEACIILDADLQHPPKIIPEFIQKWENGADVVVGIRESNTGEGLIKKYGSKLFYKIINKIGEIKIIPGSTDFRLIDRQVIDTFNRFSEHNRITRGLIDWSGFDRDFVYFKAGQRNSGKAAYGTLKLIRLAFNSFVSLSLFPLRLAGYLGILITLFSGTLGAIIFIAKYVFRNNWGTSITGSAILATIIMFLVGIILICLGLIALYIANIYQETIARPLYVIKKDKR